MIRRWVVAGGLLVSAVAHADAVTDRAKVVVQSQLDAMGKGDGTALEALFTKDAVLLADYASGKPFVQGHADVVNLLMPDTSHEQFVAVKITALVAGGDTQRMWVSAELDTTWKGFSETNIGGTSYHDHRRMTELLVADGTGWKVAAAAIGDLDRKLDLSSPKDLPVIGNPTQPGSLAKLAASPAELAAALAPGATTIVTGTDRKERAVGDAAATKLLKKWTKLGLKLGPSAREVTTATYAFAQVPVYFEKAQKPPSEYDAYVMLALVIAVPNGTGWSVVAVQYVPRE